MKHDWQLLLVLCKTSKTIKHSKTFCLVALWYLVSFVGIILNKSILSPGPNGDAIPLTVLALVQMLFTLLFAQLRQALDGRSFSIRPIRTIGAAKKYILLLGLLRFLVTVLGFVSLSFVAASFTETIKASSPLFTVAAAWLWTGERTSLPVLITLVPIVLGLAVASKGEPSFTTVGFSAALMVNCVDSVQNVFCSWLLRTKGGFSPSELQYYSALTALVLTLPSVAGEMLAGDMYVPTQVHTWFMLVGAGMVYYLQSALAFNLMSKYSPVTVSVLNTVKRALIICCSSLYFGNIITKMALFGTVIALSGSALYSFQKTSGQRIAPEKAMVAQGTARGAVEGRMLQDRKSSFTGTCSGTCRQARAASGLPRPRSAPNLRSYGVLWFVVMTSPLSHFLKDGDLCLPMPLRSKDVGCAWVPSMRAGVHRWPQPKIQRANFRPGGCRRLQRRRGS